MRTTTFTIAVTLAAALLSAVPPAAAGGDQPAALVAAAVVRAVDGDTLEVTARLWPGLTMTTRVRLLGIDTPEIKGKCDAERAAAVAARDRLAELASRTVYLKDVGPDKYFGRVTAIVLDAEGRDLAAALIAEGKGRAYAGDRRRPWC